MYKCVQKEKQNINNSDYLLQGVEIGRWGTIIGEELFILYIFLLFDVGTIQKLYTLKFK